MSRRWNHQDDVKLNHLVRQQKDWKDIVKHFPGRSEREVRARYVHRFTNRLQKLWTPDEEQKLINHYYKFGFSKWLTVARQLSRSVRECKDRWVRHIGPNLENTGIQHQVWTEAEDCEILRMFQAYGPKWGLMSNQLRGRAPNEIRCRWETRLRRRHKYNQSIRKSNFGIQVTVIRKGQDEWGKKGSTEPSYLLPRKEAEDLGYFQRRNRSPFKSLQPSVASSSGARSPRPRSPCTQVPDISDISLHDLESEFPNISTLLPDGELDDLSRLDMDFVDFLGISTDEKDDVFDELSSRIRETEETPINSGSNEDVDLCQPASLQIPIDDPDSHLEMRRSRKRKQITSSTRSACSSSPSPTTPEYLSEFVKSCSGSQPNPVSDVDDREAFIKKFKLEVERDLTELQLKTSTETETNNNALIDNSVFMGSRDGDSPPTLKSYIKKKEQYEVSQLVSPMKPSSSYDLSANSVLNLATEVENEDKTPPAKRRIMGPRFVRRIEIPNQRIINRPNQFSVSPRFQTRERRSSHCSSSEDNDSINRTLLEKYDPVRFAFRRVLQVGNDRRWRHVALGSSRTQIVMTSQAHAFLRRHTA